jgi:benzoate transport
MSDPRDILAKSSMTGLQVLVIAITVCLNALDGFDAISISYAAPGIAKDWNITRDALGIVLALDIVGMAIGSMFLGGTADKLGRRRTVLACTIVMSIGMFMATTATSILSLSVWRVLTGLGIGGMLATINAVVAEFSNQRRRDLSVSLMSTGYPVGVIIGGFLAAELLKPPNTWHSVFYLGAIATTVLIPVVFFLMPESVQWLTRKQPRGALDAINKTFKRMGRPAIDKLPPLPEAERKKSIGDIFSPGLARVTVLVTLAYFFHITTFYFIIKWVPKIVVDFGFPPSSAGNVLTWGNVGGAIGGALLGLLIQRFSVRTLTIGSMVAATVMVILFGNTPHDLGMLSAACAAAGFFINGAIVGLYVLIAKAFPTHVRAFGAGFSVGMGRGGALLSPIIAGNLFVWGYGLPTVALVMGLGSTLAAIVLLLLKSESERTAEPARQGTLKEAAARS